MAKPEKKLGQNKVLNATMHLPPPLLILVTGTVGPPVSKVVTRHMSRMSHVTRGVRSR